MVPVFGWLDGFAIMTHCLNFKSGASAFVLDQDVRTIRAVKPHFILCRGGCRYSCGTRDGINLVNGIEHVGIADNKRPGRLVIDSDAVGLICGILIESNAYVFASAVTPVSPDTALIWQPRPLQNPSHRRHRS